ncbi:MAG: hypothetical protein IPJ34_42200 [Myxococcales bacterium]|nr:hypothetical protein [Myxococcales bacterium]
MTSLREKMAGFDLAKGVRATSAAGRPAFPFASMRTLAESRHKPTRFDYVNIDPPPNTNVPRVNGTWDSEAQGVQYIGNLMYLVTKNAVWVTQILPGPTLDAIGGTQRVWEGLTEYFGRKHLRDTEAEAGPKHMGAPALFRRFLLVPAEGVDGEFLWHIRPGVDRVTKVQWVWILDLATLRYAGRIALDSATSRINDELPWLAVSEETGLLYTSRYNTNRKDTRRYTSEISVFRLPDKLWEMADNPSLPLAGGMAIDEVASYPTLQAEFLGEVPIVQEGERLNLRKVTGGALSLSGNLYLAYQNIWNSKTRSVEDDWGLIGIDALTGRVFAYASVKLDASDLQGVAVHGDYVSVCAWEFDVEPNEYQVAHFRAVGALP